MSEPTENNSGKQANMITVEQLRKPCNCRSVGECSCNDFVETDALSACVDAFGKAMKQKLIRKYMHDGYTGWDDPANREIIAQKLRSHIDKGDMVDVANLAMMLWNLGGQSR